MITCVIRPAVRADRPMLWGWRNDPVTRRMERTSGFISWEMFDQWMDILDADPQRLVMVAEYDGAGVAVAQLRAGAGMAEMGINMNPVYRGRGLAAALIEAFCARGRADLSFDRVVAEVRRYNLPSLRAFARAGFHEDGESDGIVRLSRALNSPAQAASGVSSPHGPGRV